MPTVQRFPNNPVIPLLTSSWYASQIYDFWQLVNPSNPSQLLLYCSGMAAPVQTGAQSIGLFTVDLTNPYGKPAEHGGAGNGQILAALGTGWESGGAGIRNNSVVYNPGNSTFYHYYTGSIGNLEQIGLATSTDGVTLTRYASNPILTPSEDETWCSLASVYFDGTTWYMLYAIRTTVYNTSYPAFRAATSTDGKNWTKAPYLHGLRRNAYSNNTADNEFHALFKRRGNYFLAFEQGYPLNSSEAFTLNLAVSGIPTGPYTALSYNPVLSGSGGSNWDANHVACPSNPYTSGGNEIFWYAGANNNIPTPGNTNFAQDQWPGGAAYYQGGIPLDISNIVTPSVCAWRCPIVIKGNVVSESNTYAVCLGGSGNSEAALVGRLPDHLFSHCQSDGGDVCFSSDSAGQNQLAVEIVSFNAGSKQAEIWINPALVSGSDVTIYAWYGSTAGTLQQPPANYAYGSMSVWYPNYQLVYHFPSATTINDSGQNKYNATETGMTSTAGPIGNGVVYGTGNFVTAPAINCNFASGMVSWWAYPTLAYNNNTNAQFFGWGQTPYTGSTGAPSFSCQKFTDGNYYIGFVNSSGVSSRLSFASSSSNWSQNTWQYYTYVWNASGQWLYRNGSQVGTTATVPVPQDVNNSLLLGSLQYNNGTALTWFSGNQDEFRIGNFAPSANFVATDYVIQSNNVTTSGTPLIVLGAPQYVAIPNYIEPGLGPPLPGSPWAALRKPSGPTFVQAVSNFFLSLTAQSAAWTNAALSELSAISLGQESAGWTDPALSSGSSLSLGQESAAWTDPSLALLSALGLGQESATWSDPALAQAALLSLAAESASWTNPAITTSGGNTLSLGQESAAWTNPALSSSASESLGQESAAWTNPALASASSLSAAAEAAAWSNPALNFAAAVSLVDQIASWTVYTLTPSSGGGSSLSLPVVSAVWIANALTEVFGCPPVLNPYMAGECCVISNTEPVTLYRKTADNTFDAGALVPNALRLDIAKGLAGGPHVMRKDELMWYLWGSQVGAPPLKIGDVIKDKTGIRWTIWDVDLQGWGVRYLVKTKQER